eukprot:1122841-Pyramimonas_sp.AAC.1
MIRRISGRTCGSDIRVRFVDGFYQGVPGAYSEMAVQLAYNGCEAVPCDQFEEAFQDERKALQQGHFRVRSYEQYSVLLLLSKECPHIRFARINIIPHGESAGQSLPDGTTWHDEGESEARVKSSA